MLESWVPAIILFFRELLIPAALIALIIAILSWYIRATNY